MRHATSAFAAVIALANGLAGPTWAQSSNEPTFGARTDKPDGSVALTIGRRLPIEWDTRLGMDAKLAPEPSAALADSVLVNPSVTRSSGAVWGSLTGPGVAPLIFDKTSVDARLDPGQEKGQLAATLSRTVPLNRDVSVTLQDKYSVTQSLQGSAAAPQPSSATVWQADRSLRLNLAPTSTTLSAGVVSSTNDHQWHNKLSAEQKILGPLNVTTSITDPGTAASSKSIAAGFKHTW
jgi:hypothetical protein